MGTMQVYKIRNRIMRTKVTKDGFVWAVIDKEEAVSMHVLGESVYRLYDDDSESLVENELDIWWHDCEFGIKMGFIKDLLPTCPHCGGKLIPGRHQGYEWECLECDEDFTCNEI